jgi:4-hydroxy-tetrahydrodipicolinate reductase
MVDDRVYRVVQWGTGNVGRHALRTILERPNLELVGVRVHNPDKVGVDAGVLLGGEPVGVVATDDTDEIVALDADVVCYTPIAGEVMGRKKMLDDLVRLLSSGKNVVSSAMEDFAFLGTPVQIDRAAKVHDALTEACEAGGSTYLQRGVNPGFAMDLWPVQLSTLCRRIDRLVATEVVDMSRYTSIAMMQGVGFGIPPDQPSEMHKGMVDIENMSFGLEAKLLAHQLGVEIDQVVYRKEVGVADEPVVIAAGTLPAGTVSVMKLVVDALRDGRPVITLEWIWRTTDEVRTEWPTGQSRWMVHVDGDPTLDAELKLDTQLDAKRATSLAAASLLINAVPTVCSAPPGLLNGYTLPPHAGGWFPPSP